MAIYRKMMGRWLIWEPESLSDEDAEDAKAACECEAEGPLYWRLGWEGDQVNAKRVWIGSVKDQSPEECKKIMEDAINVFGLDGGIWNRLMELNPVR